VTNPIAKSVLYSAGFPHPGHTEFLADCATRHYGGSYRAVMMLWAEELAVVPLTIHIPFLSRAQAINARIDYCFRRNCCKRFAEIF